jgi:hypothetical protein
MTEEMKREEQTRSRLREPGTEMLLPRPPGPGPVPAPHPGPLPPPPPPPPFQAASYTAELVSFQILNTRSRHEDTVRLSATLALDDGTPQTQTRDMGDLNNGTYPVGLRFGPVRVSQPTTKFVFNYLIVNSGHDSWTTVNGVLTQVGQTLAKQAATAGATAVGTLIGTEFAPGIGTLLGAFAGWLVGELTGLLTADCDGAVAAEQVVKTGNELWLATQHGAYAHTTYHPGTDSPAGCGSNSIYLATWSITRS